MPLRQDGRWHLGSLQGELANDEVIQKVLANLEDVLIRAEFSTGKTEDSGLDDLRVWSRSAAGPRLADVVASEKIRSSLRAWADGAEFISDDSRRYGWFEVGSNYTMVNGGCFLESYANRDEVLLVHPVKEGEPARIRVPCTTDPAPGARIRFDAKGTGVDPGVRIKVVCSGREIANRQVDGGWKAILADLPDGIARDEMVEIQVWPLGWSHEQCFIGSLRFETP